MARMPRIVIPGQPLHIIQRGNNRADVFFERCDYPRYLNDLREAAERHGCAIHAYVLMTNHVHLLLTPDALGPTVAEHEAAYRALFDGHLESRTLREIRDATHAGTILGGKRFRKEVEAVLRRPVTRLNHGGDRRSKAYKSRGKSRGQSC